MDLDNDRVGLGLEAVDHPVRAEERALGLDVHILPAEDREDCHAEAAGFDDEVVPSGAGLRQVGGPADVLDLADFALESPLVPDMVAQGQGVDSAIEQGLGDRTRDAGAGRGVFRIGDREVQAEFGAQLGRALLPGEDDLPTGDRAASDRRI